MKRALAAARYCSPLILIAALCACTSSTEQADVNFFEGTIVARDVRITIGPPPSIHVKEDERDECGVIFLIRPSTKIWRRNGPLTVRAAYADLVVGARVSVAAGIILESCPGQAGTDLVNLVSAG